MDCIRSVQKAIDYMEAHLQENMGYEDVARQVYMSNYHFHRTFSMLTGITPGEYIRSRRLSMAGQELLATGSKVIDIALKYGYESPESFTKAFSRFHGVSPNQVKRSDTAALRLFARLVIKVQLEGGTVMDYKIVEREAFQLLAKVQAFRNESVSEEGNTDIPDFWVQCRRDGIFSVLEHTCKKHDIYGICAPISKESPCFDYGVAMEYSGGEVPEGYRVWDIEPALWAVFPCVGKDPDCIGETWDRIYKEFLPGSDYDMLDGSDFELYPADSAAQSFCEIWIPVERK